MVTSMHSRDSHNVVEFVAQFGSQPRSQGHVLGGIPRLLGLWRTFVVSQFPQCCTMSRVGLADQGAAALGLREMSGNRAPTTSGRKDEVPAE